MGMTTTSHEADQSVANMPGAAQITASASMFKNDPLNAALLALTFVTGVIDAVSFLGLGHVLTAPMMRTRQRVNISLRPICLPSAPRRMPLYGSTSLNVEFQSSSEIAEVCEHWRGA
jgi:hypothetical protein